MSAPATPATVTRVPKDFGFVAPAPNNGPPIENAASILADTDAALGQRASPKLEYILVRPFSQIRVPFTTIGISYNTFGHAALRYRVPSTGEDVVMNVEGLKDPFVRVSFCQVICLQCLLTIC